MEKTAMEKTDMTKTDMTKILEIENVTKYYGSGAVVTKALDGISFDVEKGEFTAIMGASGSGKSTLLNVISTIDRVSCGEIRVEGRRLTGMRENDLSAFRRDRLGFIFQEYNLLDTLTIGENIVLPLHLKKLPPQESAGELKRASYFFMRFRAKRGQGAYRELYWIQQGGSCDGKRYASCKYLH